MGERQRTVGQEEMATTSTAVATVPPQTQEEPVERVAVITLRPTRAESRKKVVWTEDTVDNEHMNKKKSKCCCIYEKPRKFDESDSSDSEDDECEHCFGHVEKKKKGKHHHNHDASCPHSDTATTATTAQAGTVTITETEPAPAPEPTAVLTLQPSPTPAPAPPDKKDE